MLRHANTLDIDGVRHAVDKLFDWIRDRLNYTPNIKLLPDYQFVFEYPPEVRRIARKRRRCSTNGHMFSFREIIDGDNYTVICDRCFPHIDSRHVIVSYNPFPTGDTKVD